MTEAERAYQPMEGRKPSAEQLANPLRSLAGRPVRAKRVDLGVQVRVRVRVRDRVRLGRALPLTLTLTLILTLTLTRASRTR